MYIPFSSALSNGVLTQTNHVQWGRVLPVSENTSLHCLSCLFSELGSFSSQTRSSSGVVFALGKGRKKEWLFATCMGQICPTSAPHAALPWCSTLSDTSDMCWLPEPLKSKDMGTQKTAYVTDIVTLLDTVDSGGFKWGRSPTLLSWKLKSNHTRAEPFLKFCSIAVMLEKLVSCPLQ